MSRCIYCTEILLADGETGDRRLRSSREHIIPSALGGPDGLCTFDVCEGCNSTLGETTDGNLMREAIISMERQKFGLPGYSGKIPDVTMKASSMQTGAVYDVRIPAVGEVIYSTRPTVKQTVDPHGQEHFEVSGSIDDVTTIMTGKKAKVERQGRRMLNTDGSAIDSVDDSIAAARGELTHEFNAHFVVNQTVIWRGLIKIAFGFTHLVLGERWTFSPEAKPLRNAAQGHGSPDMVAGLVQGVDVGIRTKLLLSETAPECRHIVALMPSTEQPLVLVSLLGAPLLTIAVRIRYTDEQLEAGIARTNRIMVSTLPKGGDIQWVQLPEFASRVTSS